MSVNPEHAGGFARNPAEAEARDAAILELLKDGPASFDRCMAALPATFENTNAREFACRNALNRMKAKGQVVVAQGGWARA